MVPTAVFPLATSFTVHFTAVEKVPVPFTVAEKVWLPPGARVDVAGATLTLVTAFAIGGGTTGAGVEPAPPPHAIIKETERHRKMTAVDLRMTEALGARL